MSQNYPYGAYPSLPGYGAAPPPPPRRRNHVRGLIVTGVVALAAGVGAGGLAGHLNSTTGGTATAPRPSCPRARSRPGWTPGWST
jgi:hypothetical protein